MEMWIYLIWSSTWLISCTAAPQFVCMPDYAPIHGTGAKKYSNEEMIKRNLTDDPNYILMRTCIQIDGPKLLKENLTFVNKNDSISDAENTTLPVPPLTKDVAMFETIGITISCAVATLTLIYILACIVSYFCSKQSHQSRKLTSIWQNNEDEHPDVENQRITNSCTHFRN